MLQEMTKEFARLYPDSEEMKQAFCPYRVCPLGAHVDHQHGLVTGFAIDKGINIIYAPTDNGIVELQSKEFSKKVQFYVNNVPNKKNDWADYLRGATKELGSRYELENGIVALIYGSIPIGGLSSSAAVILGYLSALCRANGLKISEKELVDVAYTAERNYVGVNCGKLDQSCEVLCKKNSLLYLDTADESFEIIPKNENMKDFEIAVFFSGVERNLYTSPFNMRVDEAKAASYALKAFGGEEYGKFDESFLRDVPKEVFEKYADALPENWRKRALHFYTEMDRVRLGVEAWRGGDIEKFGKICNESGHSSIYNWETGSDELKTLCEILWSTEGVYGARFSGAGFKGSCMAIVNPEFKAEIKKTVTEKYLEIFPQYEETFSVHFCKTTDGCKIKR